VYVIASPFASLDPEPSRVTLPRVVTVWAGPALATGATFAVVTVTFTVEGALARLASLTTRLNVNVVGDVTVGGVNVGFTTVARDKVTAGPAVWGQA